MSLKPVRSYFAAACILVRAAAELVFHGLCRPGMAAAVRRNTGKVVVR